MQTLGRFLSFRMRATQYTSHKRLLMPACGTAYTHQKLLSTYGLNQLSMAKLSLASAGLEEASTDVLGEERPEEAYGKVGHLCIPVYSVTVAVNVALLPSCCIMQVMSAQANFVSIVLDTDK